MYVSIIMDVQEKKFSGEEMILKCWYVCCHNRYLGKKYFGGEIWFHYIPLLDLKKQAVLEKSTPSKSEQVLKLPRVFFERKCIRSPRKYSISPISQLIVSLAKATALPVVKDNRMTLLRFSRAYYHFRIAYIIFSWRIYPFMAHSSLRGNFSHGANYSKKR